MEELLTSGKTIEIGEHKRSRSSMESSIVDTMNRYFRDEKGRMGNMELSIIESVKRYFEGPPNRAARTD
jgi:hypothetical protein